LLPRSFFVSLFFAQLFLKLGVGSGAFFKVFPQKNMEKFCIRAENFFVATKTPKKQFQDNW